MSSLILAIASLVLPTFSLGDSAVLALFVQQPYEEDFDFLWNEVAASYAYFDKKQTDWDKVKEIYRTRVKGVTTRQEFIALLEQVLEELYDSHAHLNTNTASSPRLVPSGLDVWAEWRDDRAIITQVRGDSAADRAGLKVGMEIESINGIGVGQAVSRRIGASLRSADRAANNWALRVLLAGRHNEDRRIGVRSGDSHQEIKIKEQKLTDQNQRRLETKRFGKDGGIAYVRFNNSLGSLDLIKEFDAALTELRGTEGLLLDLRDTPGGGNSTVARAIMGRFIDREGFYQKHSVPGEERQFGIKRSWIEIVSPRGDYCYSKPVVLLVDHWTGSMGEGIAIGMDALKRAEIVGTEMAGLLGATYEIRLPKSGIGVNFPGEKLFHVNGTPREDFTAPIHVDLLDLDNQRVKDPILEKGMERLLSALRRANDKK